ncbi:MAG TPA: VOC family protein [Candidatus Acidoferrales bacterium]|nr:VOC family protein [Candidatus Acidoferrales bacterium]
MSSNPKPAADSSASVGPIRKGFRSITPYLIVPGASGFGEFLKKVFGAEELLRVPATEGKIMHAEARVGGAMLEFADSNAEVPPAPGALHFYVDDVDATYTRALNAGAKSITAPADQSYGERSASVEDPFGNRWYLAKRLGGGVAPTDGSNLIICLHPIGAEKLIEFMEKGCGSEVVQRFDRPDGKVMHAKLRLGNSIIELSEAHGPYQPLPMTIHYYLADTDAAYERAISAGAKTLREPRDEVYGDRSAGVTDPFGNRWFFATHIKDVQF